MSNHLLFDEVTCNPAHYVVLTWPAVAGLHVVMHIRIGAVGPQVVVRIGLSSPSCGWYFRARRIYLHMGAIDLLAGTIKHDVDIA
eukprot:1152142-Pyramimonas_sp.AAC.1